MKDYLELAVGIVLALVILIAGLQLAQAAPLTWQAHAAKVEEAYDLPHGLLRAICEQESHWRNVTGRHGEIGVCQIKPATVAMICPECAGNAKRRLFALGTRGDEVARIQAVLAREGYYGAALDGIYGPKTRHAVLSYQRQAGIGVDGIVGPQTWGSMFGAHDAFPGQTIADALWDPHANIEWAARYLVWIRENVSADPGVMITAYNGGPGHPVVRYLRQVRERMRI